MVGVVGVNDDNKDEVCDSIASALGGVSTYCSLSGPQSSRRRLESDTSLYTNAAVRNAALAETQATSSEFIASLQNLPAEVTVIKISTFGTKSTWFDIKSQFFQENSIL